MHGIIIDAPTAHRRKVKVNPITRAYHESHERPYIKYSCPVCDTVGNTKISVPYGTPRCPLCGVALNWEREIESGDNVVILDTSQKLQKAVVVSGPTKDSPTTCGVKITGTNKTRFFPTDKISILEEYIEKPKQRNRRLSFEYETEEE